MVCALPVSVLLADKCSDVYPVNSSHQPLDRNMIWNIAIIAQKLDGIVPEAAVQRSDDQIETSFIPARSCW